MGGVTAKGFPYPTGTDRVADGDNAIQALAAAVDAYLETYAQCWGAATIGDTGPGVGQTQWFTNCGPIGVAGGVTVGGNGITVPRKGWYQVHAVGLVGYGQPGASSTALLIGDGANAWAVGSDEYGASPLIHHTVTAMTVVNLPAGTLIRWGMANSGPSGAGIYGGANYSVLFARLILPVA